MDRTGSGGPSGASRGHGTEPRKIPTGPRAMTQKTDWLFQGTGKKLTAMLSSEVQPSPLIVTSSGGYNLVCSYNWLERTDPTVYVPGRYFIDQNQFRVPEYPFEVVFRALEVMNPDFKFNNVDVLVNRNTLRKLLDYCAGKQHNDFRLNLFVVQNTLIIERCEEKLVDMIRGVGNNGWGHNFEAAITRSLPGMENIVGYHRVLEYYLGNLRCAVRFEIDAFVDDSSGIDASLAAQVGSLSLGTPTVNLVDTLRALQIREAETAKELSNIHVISRGSFVPHTHAAEIKSIGRPKSLNEVLPQLWFGRTQNLIRGHHNDGVFHKIDVNNVGQDLRVWETQLRPQDALRKVVTLLDQLRSIAQKSEGKACVVVVQQQFLKVFAATERKTPLPEDVTKKFWAKE
ncbi:hypothetical protein QQX98_007265 [Neonectria punicea]|uniref:Uncharacterized protein n=1 Tax=Neonectria punicea TaxID=979145 RepID=A0ABR1GYE4_9HYPO